MPNTHTTRFNSQMIKLHPPQAFFSSAEQFPLAFLTLICTYVHRSMLSNLVKNGETISALLVLKYNGFELKYNQSPDTPPPRGEVWVNSLYPYHRKSIVLKPYAQTTSIAVVNYFNCCCRRTLKSKSWHEYYEQIYKTCLRGE